MLQRFSTSRTWRECLSWRNTKIYN